MKQKILIRVTMTDDKTRAKAMKTAAQFKGVSGVEIKGDHRNQIEVTGVEVNMICLTNTLRKKVAFAELVSVNKVEPPKKEDEKKKDEKKADEKKADEKKADEKKADEKKRRRKRQSHVVVINVIVNHVIHHGLTDMVCHLPLPTHVIPMGIILGIILGTTTDLVAGSCEKTIKDELNSFSILSFFNMLMHFDSQSCHMNKYP